MQFSDDVVQMVHDADAIFARERSRGARWGTGTEAGDDALRRALRAAARRNGYRFTVDRDVWVAVDEAVIEPGSWKTGFELALESFEGTGKHTDKGVAWAQWDDVDLGQVTVGAGHYLTRGRPSGKGEYRENLDENLRFARVIGDFGREHGKGSALVFYNGDQNIVDRIDDTFLGEDFTSSWDELGRYENTGHGNIDVLASWDHDGRVSAGAVRALDDSEFRLFTDHFLVEGSFLVKPKR
jgi:hypothetical protein